MSDSPIDRSRRGFFTGSLLTREGRETVQKQVVRLGIYPPGLKPVSSMDNCTSCSGLCAKSCPQKIIKSHPNNHQLANQPYLDFSTNGCTFCNECNQACPEYSDQTPAQASLGKALLNRQQCYAWLDIICMSCISVCPDQLIKFNSNRKPSIQLEPCSGCGSCIKVCPATAISITKQMEA